jgi:hypothetical protein
VFIPLSTILTTPSPSAITKRFCVDSIPLSILRVTLRKRWLKYVTVIINVRLAIFRARNNVNSS